MTLLDHLFGISVLVLLVCIIINYRSQIKNHDWVPAAVALGLIASCVAIFSAIMIIAPDWLSEIKSYYKK